MSFDSQVDGSTSSGLLAQYLTGGSQHNGTHWDQWYVRFTQRHPNGCLSVDKLDATTYGDQDYGDPVTFALRLVIGVAAGLAFFRWQLVSRNHWPTKRLVPDLQNKGPHRAKVQCLLFNCMPANPHFGFRISIPLMPTKPYEFIDTGMWQSFVFTWPYSPRFDEPLLTQCARDTVSILILAMQLLFFIVLGTAAASWADVTKQGWGFGAVVAVCNVYIVSAICAVSKLIFIAAFGWSVNSGGCAVLAMAAVSSSLLGLLVIGTTTALTNLTCSEFAVNIIMPFLLKQPMALVAAPILYAFKNSFGSGPGVKGLLKIWDEIDELSAHECVERLTYLGRAADLHVADDEGKVLWWLNDVLEDVEAADDVLLESLRRALKETTYVVEASLLHVGAGLDKMHKKTGQWKVDRDALVKKLKGAHVVDVVKRHPIRNWRVSDIDMLERVLSETAGSKQPQEAEMADSPRATEEDEVSTEDLRILLKEILWWDWMTVPSMNRSGEGQGRLTTAATFEVSPLLRFSGSPRSISSPTTGLGVSRASLGSNRSVSRQGHELTRSLSNAWSTGSDQSSPKATLPPSPPAPGTKRGKTRANGGSENKGKSKRRGQELAIEATSNPLSEEAAQDAL